MSPSERAALDEAARLRLMTARLTRECERLRAERNALIETLRRIDLVTREPDFALHHAADIAQLMVEVGGVNIDVWSP